MQPLKMRAALSLCLPLLAGTMLTGEPARAAPFGGPNDNNTVTPIKHVIIIMGENRSFDHLFATYQPEAGQQVLNLLSEGIVNADGTAGPNYAAATQMRAVDTTTYAIDPKITQQYPLLPPPNTEAAHTSPSDTIPPPFATKVTAAADDYELLASDIYLLTLGATNLPLDHIDTRERNWKNLASGPFQLSPGIADDFYAGDPVHKFFQMWQQADCAAAYATAANPSGCRMNLYPWVAVTIGHGNTGKPLPSPYTYETTDEGGNSMGFYNMAAGDINFFKRLADRYAIGDNFHQSVFGGTAPNSIMLEAADVFWYSDGDGNAIAPPAAEIINPNPEPGTNNWYTEDADPSISYVECSDPTQPGVASIDHYLELLPYHPNPNCAPGLYYMVENRFPGYLGDGTLAKGNGIEPPSSTPTIADVLLAAGVSWTYFGGGFDAYLANPHKHLYCTICNAFQYETAIMTNTAVRTNDLQDTKVFFTDVAAGELPAVSFVKPMSWNDGHPVSSTPALFEAFVRNILSMLANSALRQDTAVFITFDESGGFYDSGPIQPLDFFGDGPRIPIIVVSNYSTGGRVVHTYADQVSLLKFIEKNWSLPVISSRSRDNLPDAVMSASNPYVPTNSPAIDDMMDFFRF